MATSTTPAVATSALTQQTGAMPFDYSKPPIIEGFTTLTRRHEETFKEKMIRKTKENPFVPLGCLGTAGVLTFGLRAFRAGQAQRSQQFMRVRIIAQGCTVVAVILGVFVTALKPKE